MNHKSFGWAAVLGCILSVTVAVIGGRESQPPAAQAYSAQNGASFTDRTACKAVMDQMNAIRHGGWDKSQTGEGPQLAAMDNLVCRAAQIDTSKCPADFCKAEAKYVASLNTMSVDAHINFADNGKPAFCAMFYDDSQPYLMSMAANASNAMKRDLQMEHNAQQDFQQAAARYDAN